MLPKENPLPVVILADALAKGWDATERLEKRLQSFDTLKTRGFDFIDWATQNQVATESPATKKIFRQMLDCGQYLIFRNYLLSKRSRLIGSCSCKYHLLCPFCASRRGVKHSAIYKQKVDGLRHQNNHNLDLVFLTFTVKNGPDLYERFTHLRTSIKALLKRRNNQKNNDRIMATEMFRLSAGVFSYEFKRGQNSNAWHPHIHMLALLPNHQKINIQLLKNEWQDITGDSSVINIKYADDDAFLEVFAYALKFSEMENSDRWAAFNLLRRERLISSFGDLRGLEMPENDNDDPLDTDEPFVDSLYRWVLGRGYELGFQLTK